MRECTPEPFHQVTESKRWCVCAKSRMHREVNGKCHRDDFDRSKTNEEGAADFYTARDVQHTEIECGGVERYVDVRYRPYHICGLFWDRQARVMNWARCWSRHTIQGGFAIAFTARVCRCRGATVDVGTIGRQDVWPKAWKTWEIVVRGADGIYNGVCGWGENVYTPRPSMVFSPFGSPSGTETVGRPKELDEEVQPGRKSSLMMCWRW